MKTLILWTALTGLLSPSAHATIDQKTYACWVENNPYLAFIILDAATSTEAGHARYDGQEFRADAFLLNEPVKNLAQVAFFQNDIKVGQLMSVYAPTGNSNQYQGWETLEGSIHGKKMKCELQPRRGPRTCPRC